MKKQTNETEKKDFKEESKSRGRRRKPRTRRPNSRPSRGDSTPSETNDPAWYSASPELLRDAASIPFSWPVGTSMGNSGKIANDIAMGIMVEDVWPSVGHSSNVNSPINVAANAIYSFVRHANSGHANYEAPDLMLYLVAMSNIYSFVTWCQRLLGMVSIYDQRNRYFPRGLFAGARVDYEDFMNNIANFRYWLNTYISKVASLAVPNTMNIFPRLAFLYSGIYIDGPTVKDQLYMYNPSDLHWYSFGIDSGTGMGKLDLVTMSKSSTRYAGRATVNDIIEFGTNIFNNIWDQEDFGIMSGDILKAYGDNIIKLAMVPADFSLMPSYDPMVLHQMKNAKVAAGFIPTSITQDDGGVIHHSCLLSNSLGETAKNTCRDIAKLNQVLTSDFDSPEPAVVIESSRLMFSYSATDDSIFTGTEILHQVRYLTLEPDASITEIILNNDFGLYGEGNTARLLAVAKIAWTVKSFKYAPESYVGIINLDGHLKADSVYRLWDIDNYAVLNGNDIEKLHEAALMSLFAVPAIAKIS